MPSNPAAYGFEVPPQGFKELATVAAFADRLPDLQALINRLGTSATTDQIRDAVASTFGINATDASLLLRGLLTLRSLAASVNLTAHDLLDALTASLEAQAPADWTETILPAWEAAKEKIIAAISPAQDDVLGVRSKIRELTFLHERIVLNCRLVTEFRPVYNIAGDKIVNTVLTTALFIRYRAHGEVEEMQLELDLKDVAELRTQCERAERKVATAARMFRESGWEITIAGAGKQEDAE